MPLTGGDNLSVFQLSRVQSPAMSGKLQNAGKKKGRQITQRGCFQVRRLVTDFGITSSVRQPDNKKPPHGCLFLFLSLGVQCSPSPAQSPH